MANLRTGRDIIEHVLFRMGERTDGSSNFQDSTVVNVNRAWHSLQAGGSEIAPEINEVWDWAVKLDPKTIVLEPQIQTTVTTTQGSTTITLGAAPVPLIDTAVDNWWLFVQDVPEVHRISTHTAATTTAELGTVWARTAVSGKSCWLVKTDYDYDATNVLDIRGPLRTDESGIREITEVTPADLQRTYPLRNRPSGVPVHFVRLGQIGDTTDGQRLRFSHGGRTDGSPIYVRFDAEVHHADIAFDSTEIPMPLRWRTVLADFATYLGLLDKNDARASSALALAQAGLRAMARDNRNRLGKTGVPSHLFPRQTTGYSTSKKPYQISSGAGSGSGGGNLSATGTPEDNQVAVWTTSQVLEGNSGLTFDQLELAVQGSLSLQEKAAAHTDTAGYGQLWVKNDAPNTLYFTDDDGNDLAIVNTSGTQTLTNKTLGATTLAGTLDVGAQIIHSNLISVVTSVSGTLTTAAHLGRLLVTSGNITVPTTTGFHCLVKFGGAHTVTFNSTTSPAAVSGTVASIYVQSATVIIMTPFTTPVTFT